MASGFRIYETMSRKLQVFEPVQKPTKGKKPKVRLYTCGPTVYNYAHIGNWRAYLWEDLLRRYLKFKGFDVIQVMNLTDVDDKTIRDSIKEGLPLKDFTEKYIKAFFEDLDKLNIERAEVYPRATDHIPEMIALIEVLLKKGIAYKTDDGCVWFSITKFPDYGALAHIDTTQLQAGASGRILNDEYDKEQAADFALWKGWDEGDGDVAWESPFGRGRPGWHIECSAMSMKHLTKAFKGGKFDQKGFETIDLHTGGVDNMFPHHEDEIAQSEAVTGKKFVKYWMHVEHLLVDNKKMAKSAGNFYTLRDLIAKGHDPRTFRYLIQSVSYHQKLNFTFEALGAAKEALKAIDDFILNLGAAKAPADCKELPSLLDKLESEFTASMDDDLNTSPAFASIHIFMRDINRIHPKLSKKDAEKILVLFKRIDSVLGVMSFEREQAPKELIDLADQRDEARRKKDWKESDRLRDLITKAGWVVEDLPEGPRLKKV
ncbi:MAG: cysteine--tRNA ligase [Nanoarchaeota archaeon]